MTMSCLHVTRRSVLVVRWVISRRGRFTEWHFCCHLSHSLCSLLHCAAPSLPDCTAPSVLLFLFFSCPPALPYLSSRKAKSGVQDTEGQSTKLSPRLDTLSSRLHPHPLFTLVMVVACSSCEPWRQSTQQTHMSHHSMVAMADACNKPNSKTTG